MKPVSIQLIAEALESAMDEWQQFLDLETGLIHQLPEDPWIREEIGAEDLAKGLEESPDRFLALPERYEIREFNMMEVFCTSLNHAGQRDGLLQTLKGSRPFRRFKDRLNCLGLAQDYYDFRLQELRQLAIRWCQAKGLPYQN